jgi:hypothetical protein
MFIINNSILIDDLKKIRLGVRLVWVVWRLITKLMILRYGGRSEKTVSSPDRRLGLRLTTLRARFPEEKLWWWPATSISDLLYNCVLKACMNIIWLYWQCSCRLCALRPYILYWRKVYCNTVKCIIYTNCIY